MATKKKSRSKDPAALPIYAIARAVDMSSRELRDTISSWDDVDWDVSNHMKKLDLEAQLEIEKRLGVEFVEMSQAADKPAKKATKKKPAAKKATTKKGEPKKAAKKAEADKKADASDDDTTAAAAEGKPTKPKKAAKKKATKKPAPQQPQEDVEIDNTDYVKVGNDWLRETLKVMGFQHPRVSGEQDDRAIRFTINGADTENLLGSLNAAANTTVVESLQQVMARAIYGDRHRNAPTVLIDVQGFRAGRTKGITRAAQALASWARSNPGKRVRVAAINTFDRHAFHNVIGDESDMRTESFGRGARRRLEIQTTQRQHDHGNRDDENNDDE